MCLESSALRQLVLATGLLARLADAFVPGGIVHSAHVRIPPAVSHRPGGDDAGSHGGRAGARWSLTQLRAGGDPTLLPTEGGRESHLRDSVVFIDDMDACRKAIEPMLLMERGERLAVAVQGDNLGRGGAIELLQISVVNSSAGEGSGLSSRFPVYVFDIGTLQGEAFKSQFVGGGGLRALLGNRAIQKVFYDVRSASDALFRQYDVRLESVVDLQVLYSFYRVPVSSGVTTLPYALRRFVTEAQVNDTGTKKVVNWLVEKSRKLSRQEAEMGSMWAGRPLRQDLLEYAVADVRYLLPMVERFVRPPQREIGDKEVVERFKRVMGVTNDRVRTVIESRRWEPDAPVVFIDDVASCRRAAEHIVFDLKHGERLAVTLEGDNVSRGGAVALLQLAVEDISFDARGKSVMRRYPVFVFDISKMQSKAFKSQYNGGGGLREVLEAPYIEKLFFDVQPSADALFNQFNVRMKNVVDVQVLCTLDGAWPNAEEFASLPGARGRFMDEGGVNDTVKQAVTAIEDKAAKVCEPDRGGSYGMWARRPLHEDLLAYAVARTKLLIPMADLFARQREESVADRAVKERFKRAGRITMARIWKGT